MLYAVLLLAALVAAAAKSGAGQRRADEYPVPREALNALHPEFHSVRKSTQSNHKIQFDSTGEPIYVYAKFYEDSYCSTYKIFYFGYLAGTCLNGYDLMNNPTGSVLFTSNNFESVTINSFSDANCQGASNNGTTYDNNFCNSMNGSPNINSRYSYIFGAYPGNTYPAVTQDMVAVVGYQGNNSLSVSQCAYNGVDSLISMFMAYNVDNCFAHGSHSSFYLQCPNGAKSTSVDEILFSSSSVCQFGSTTSSFDTGCISQTSSEYSAINNVLGMSQFSSDVLGHRNLVEEVSRIVHVPNDMPKKLTYPMMRQMSETYGTKLSEEALGNYVINGTSAGYFTAAMYFSNDTCGGDADMYGGLLTNTCMNEYDLNSNVVGSMYYACVNGALNYYEFQSGDCGGTPYSGYFMNTQNCSYNNIFESYAVISCTNDIVPMIPAGYGGTFEYDGSSAVCQSTPIEYFVNKADSTCYAQNYSSSSMLSCAADGTLTEMFFDSSNCTGSNSTQVYLGECLSVDLFAYDDYEVNSDYSVNVYFRKTCVVNPPTYSDDEFSNTTFSSELYEYTEIKCIAPAPSPTKQPTTPVAHPTTPPVTSPTMAPTYAGISCNISKESYYALESFYFSLNGYFWSLTGSETPWYFDNSIALSVPCSNSWVGLLCVEVQPGFCEIEGLFLPQLSLFGSIPDMSGFSSLKWLDLSQNNIFGSLSDANFSTTLRTLDVSVNGIDGLLPSAFAQLDQLNSLFLGSNALQGPIPTEWSTMTALEYFSLESNFLTSTLPEEFSTLSNMENLILNYNDFIGTIPESWGSLSALMSIQVSSNELSGSLPKSWSQLSTLRTLDFSGNELSGIIPPSYALLENLGDLDMYGNKLSGIIPSLSGQLEYVSLGGNQLSGNIPDSLVKSSVLLGIDVSDNSLTGTMPSIWGNMQAMEGLNLEMNSFYGPIPTAWSVMTQLESLGFCGGQLTGTIPEWISGMSSLYQLTIGGGNVTGTIPEAIFSSQSLEFLSIMGNSLDGTLPSSLANLTNLFGIFITANYLSGPLPNLQTSSMYQIMIEGNGFSGPIPSTWTFENLFMLQISGILLTGSLPSALSNAQQLQYLALIGTSISGSFPTDYFFPNLMVAYLIGNFNLTGPLPSSIQMPSVSSLIIQYNSFTGGVPELPPYTQVAYLNSNKLSGNVSYLNCDLQYLSTLILTGNGPLCIPQCLYTKFPSQFLGPSNCSFFNPSVAPTSSPTAVQIFDILASQTLVNITVASFMQASVISVFEQAVAVSMNNSGILSSDVNVTSANQVQGRRLTSTNNLQVSYTVTVNVAATGFTSMSASYSALSANLETAVNTGAFTTTLNTLAVANSCSQLQYVSSSSIAVIGQGIPTASPIASPTASPTVSPTLQPTQSSGSSSSSNGTPQSTVIAVAVVVPIVVVAAAIGGFVYYKSQTPTTQAVTKDADTKNVFHNEL